MNQRDLLCNPEYQKILSTIDKEVDYVNEKEYSRNIISLSLHECCEKFGYEVTNDIIVEFDLECLGWSKVDKEDNI
jgi:hypothetical protein